MAQFFFLMVVTTSFTYFSATDHHAMLAITANVTSHLFIKDPYRFIYGWQCFSTKVGMDSCNRVNSCAAHPLALLIMLVFPPSGDHTIVKATLHDSR